MFNIHIWNRFDISLGKQSLNKIKVSDDFSKLLVLQNEENYPLISDLSLDDYSLFTYNQLDDLNDEFSLLNTKYPEYTNEIMNIKDSLKIAIEMRKEILFDPFTA